MSQLLNCLLIKYYGYLVIMLNTLFSRLLIHRNIYLAILILGELTYAFKFESCFAYSPLNIPEYN